MSVQIALELSQTIIESVIGRAGIFGCYEIAAQTTDLGQKDTGTIMVPDKQCQKISNGS